VPAAVLSGTLDDLETQLRRGNSRAPRGRRPAVLAAELWYIAAAFPAAAVHRMSAESTVNFHLLNIGRSAPEADAV